MEGILAGVSPVVPIWVSAAVTALGVLKVGTLVHGAKHRHDEEAGASERYKKLADSVPHELWAISARIKEQRGVCVGAPEAEVRLRQTLVRGRMKARGYPDSDIQKYLQPVTALTLE